MYKFAHIADCHLGAQKDSNLKKLEIESFEECMNICIEQQVDFIIIAGDLFHSNLPDMGVVKKAVGILKKVNESNINIYINYGSHDFSPNDTSIIDIITESGLLKKVYSPEILEDNGNGFLKLNFTTDPRTNAKLIGIPGRKAGIEEQYYENLNKENFNEISGFKIFVFHTGIKEILPKFLSNMDGISINKLPKNFNYYAGGHIHKKIISDDFKDFGPVRYPGPLFGGYPRDFEFSAKGEKRGFFIVDFDEKVENIEFCEIPIAKYELIQIKVNNETSHQFNDRVLKEIEKKNVNNKIIILKLKGDLSGGKTSEINFHEIKKVLNEKGAINVNINHHSLKSKEFSNFGKVDGETTAEKEENIFKENISTVNIDIESLKGIDGTKKAIELLKTIRQSSKQNEKKQDYNNRIIKDALKILDIEELPNDI